VYELPSVHLEAVDRAGSARWNADIDRYHYLGYKPLPAAERIDCPHDRYHTGRSLS